MKNLKSLTITQDGNAKRLAVTYDEVNENGKVVKPNMRLNRIITDDDALKTIADIETIAYNLMEE